jgi:copper resistance protein D
VNTFPYFVNVTIHVLAAMLWLGGMFFLGVVGAPALRDIEPAQVRQRIFQSLGARFRAAGWMAIVILVITGILNLRFRGWLAPVLSGRADFFHTAAGTALEWKLGAVVAMIVVSAVHDFWLGPAAGRASPGTPAALRLRRRAALLARVNALAGVVVVIAAVRLARS